MGKTDENIGSQSFNVKKRSNAEKRGEYRTWLARLPNSIILLGPDNKIVYVNPAFVRTTGYLLKEVIGLQPPYPFWPVEKQTPFLANFERKSWHSKLLLLKRNGDSLPVEVNLNQVKSTGSAICRLVSFQAIAFPKEINEITQLSALSTIKLLDAIPIPISIATYKDRRFIYVNSSFEKISGFSKHEIIGRQTSDLPWTNNQIGARQPANLVKLGKLSDVEMSLTSKTGVPHTSIVKSQKVKLGKEFYRVAASIDITDRKKAEEALFASEYRYHSTLENTLEGCQIIGFDWRFLFINDASVKQARGEKEAILGKTVMQVFPGIENSTPFKAIQNCMMNRVSCKVENEFVFDDGSTCWFELSIHPVPEGIFILSVDINARKFAEDQARRLLIQQQTILNNIPDMAWLKDKDLRFIAVNQALLNFARLTAEQIIGKTDLEIFPETHAQKYMQDDQNVIKNAVGVIVEDPLPTRDSEIIWFESSKMPLLNEKKEVVGLAGIARDITVRKKNENELQQLNQVLRTISDVNQIISHEKDPQKLLESACRSLTDVRGYAACWIAQLDENNRLSTAAESNIGNAFTLKKQSLMAGILPNCAALALSQGKAVIMRANDPVCQNCPAFRPIAACSKVLVMPIHYSGHVQGVITVIAGSAISIDDEEINLLQAMANDIGLALYNIRLEDQRVKVESELKISEERFRLMSEVADDLIYRVNLFPQLKLDYISPSFQKMLGYSYFSNDVVADRILEILHPDDQAVMMALLNNPAGLKSDALVLRWRHQQGQFVHVEHRHSMIFDIHGKPVAVVGIGRDITMRIYMEESLKASEMFSQRLLEDSPNPIIVVNDDTSIRYANPALFSLTGFSQSEIIGCKSPYPWWPTDRIAENQAIAQRNRRLGKAEQERIFQKKNGELFWVIVSVRGIENNGQLEYTLSSWIDITERKKAEMALQESEAYSLGLISNAPNPILVTNVDGSIKSVNQAFEKLTGYCSQELVGILAPYPWWPANLQTLFLTEDQQSWGNQIARLERQYQKKNGQGFWISLSISTIRDDSGNIRYFVSNWVDITASKNAERALLESEEKTRLIFTSIADGVVITDLQGFVIDCNDSCVNMARIPREKLIGLNISVFLLVDDRSRAMANMQKIIVNGISDHIQYVLVRLDGSTFPADTTASVAKNAEGIPLYLVISFQDITERKQMEDRIIELYEKEKRQREELQEEASARGMFIDVLAHELRTPLTPILASTGMLNDLLGVSEDSLLKKLCANISNGAEILAHRLEELLDVARYSRGVFHLNRSPVNLRTFIHESLLRFKPTLDQRHQYLITSVSDTLPMALVDSSRMEQVIINLLSNASKFSLEKGNIYFNASYQEEILNIEVRDEGIGITNEEQRRLFQPYHRVEQDRQKFPGIGLGLAVSKQIVEAHGGKISVESQLGRGSTFSLSIPLKVYDI
jgi:PAS domain S-box-containing protein